VGNGISYASVVFVIFSVVGILAISRGGAREHVVGAGSTRFGQGGGGARDHVVGAGRLDLGKEDWEVAAINALMPPIVVLTTFVFFFCPVGPVALPVLPCSVATYLLSSLLPAVTPFPVALPASSSSVPTCAPSTTASATPSSTTPPSLTSLQVAASTSFVFFVTLLPIVLKQRNVD
jgi:hypothetical protein